MLVADIQRFCMHDGAGVRTTVFLKGCPLKCLWCHNPETQSAKKELLFYHNKCIGCGSCNNCKQKAHIFNEAHTINHNLCIECGECAADCPTNALEIIGKEYTPQELLTFIKKDLAFYGENGGVTLSGGEPFLQSEDTLSLLELCKENGINTAVETCGYTSPDIIKRAIPLVDLFLWDIKDTDSHRHKEYTGVSNETIINNLKSADSLGAKTRIRCILVNGVNTENSHYENLVNIVSNLKNCEGVEFLPYHSYGNAKTLAQGKKIISTDEWIPSKECILKSKEYLKNREIPVF